MAVFMLEMLKSSGIKVGRFKVDDQVEKNPRFSKKKTGFYSQKTVDATNSAANQLKCAKHQIHLHVNMAETLLNCFAASEVLFSTSLKNKRYGNANVFKMAKSVKEAVFGRNTWLVHHGQQERKEAKNWR